MAKHTHLACKECGKEHTRTWNIADGFGNCNSCGGVLELPKKLAREQDRKAKEELKELGW